MTTIDLNCDMGESFGAYTVGADEAVMAEHHVGERRLRLPRRRSWRDAANDRTGARRRRRGRRASGISRSRGIRASRDANGTTGRRRHGPLPNRRACRDCEERRRAALAREAARCALQHGGHRQELLAAAIARAVAAFDPALIFFALPGSELARAANAIGSASRARGVCRSRVRARRIVDAALTCRRSHSRRRRGRRRERCGWSSTE